MPSVCKQRVVWYQAAANRKVPTSRPKVWGVKLAALAHPPTGDKASVVAVLLFNITAYNSSATGSL